MKVYKIDVYNIVYGEKCLVFIYTAAKVHAAEPRYKLVRPLASGAQSTIIRWETDHSVWSAYYF